MGVLRSFIFCWAILSGILFAADGASKDVAFIWSNSEDNHGWVVLGQDGSLVGAMIVAPGSPPISISVNRTKDQDNVLVEVELNPINIRVAGTTKGYALRVSRKSTVVPLTDVKRLMVPSGSNGYFAAMGCAGRQFAESLEAQNNVPSPDELIALRDSGAVEFAIPNGVVFSRVGKAQQTAIP